VIVSSGPPSRVRTVSPVTRPAAGSKTGFTADVPSRNVTLLSARTLLRIARSRHGRLTTMPHRPASCLSFHFPN